MKALQELIPRCNKVSFILTQGKVDDSVWDLVFGFVFEQTDKASMLEDAIEYVKSLQLQIQACPKKKQSCISFSW